MLKLSLHAVGVNLCFLGAARQGCSDASLRGALLCEGIARVLRRRVRHAMAGASIPQSANAAADELNALLGLAADADPLDLKVRWPPVLVFNVCVFCASNAYNLLAAVDDLKYFYLTPDIISYSTFLLCSTPMTLPWRAGSGLECVSRPAGRPRAAWTRFPVGQAVDGDEEHCIDAVQAPHRHPATRRRGSHLRVHPFIHSRRHATVHTCTTVVVSSPLLIPFCHVSGRWNVCSLPSPIRMTLCPARVMHRLP